MKKYSLLLILFFLIGCNQPQEPVPSSPEETPVEEVMPQEETKEEQKFLSPEDMAGAIALGHAGEGRIISMVTREHNGIPVIEVQIQQEEELLVYLVDPAGKSIESVITKNQADEGFSLEEGHFLAREHMEGQTELRVIEDQGDEVLYTLKQGSQGKVFRVDKTSKKVEFVKDEKDLFELRGKVNIDLFQAIQKLTVFFGEMEIKSIGYIPYTDETSAIEVKFYLHDDEEKVLRSVQLDTYSGVIFYQDF